MKTRSENRRIFRLTSETQSSAAFIEYLVQALESLDYTEKDIFALRLAVEEAFANAIKHGNHDNPTKFIRVEAIIDDRRASICVEDEGSGFCVTEVRDPTLAECIQLPRGRGIFLMRSFMDSVQYNAVGNVVTMIRRRSTL